MGLVTRGRLVSEGDPVSLPGGTVRLHTFAKLSPCEELKFGRDVEVSLQPVGGTMTPFEAFSTAAGGHVEQVALGLALADGCTKQVKLGLALAREHAGQVELELELASAAIVASTSAILRSHDDRETVIPVLVAIAKLIRF